MTTHPHDSQLLAALLDLARADVPATAIRAAARLGRTPDEVREALARLDAAGLVDACRCRLTFAGLAVAASGAGRLRAAPIPAPVRRALRAA